VFKRKNAIADNATRNASRLARLPLEIPLALKASSLTPAGRYEIGDTVGQKDVASARP
jgi:hypothetical protein